jgi:hypothetical protein
MVPPGYSNGEPSVSYSKLSIRKLTPVEIKPIEITFTIKIIE